MITSILKRMQPNRPHLAVLVVLLSCSLVLTSFLAYQGYDAAKNQRLQAEQQLRELASLAALKWHERIQNALYTTQYYIFEPALKNPEGVKADPERLLRLIQLESLCHCATSADASTAFTFDFERSLLRAAGGGFTEVARSWLIRGLNENAGVTYQDPDNQRRWKLGTLVGAPGENRRVIFYIAALDATGRPTLAWGFEASPDLLARYLDYHWKRSAPLLPGTGHAHVPNDWILSARVVDPQGRLWYESRGRYPPMYVATDTMNHLLSGLGITVAVNPDRAGDLLIGGLPSSRLRTMLALLALTAGLLIVAIVLIRREAEITRLRSDFIAGVSHELRTPLAQIRMFSETLLLGRVRTDSERQRSLEIIDQEARRLTHLVENVLLFARAERRSGRINPEPIDLAADVRDAVHGFAILCRTKAVEIRPELQEGVTAPVDRGALRQILLNLLDNAAKYGPLGQRITVGLALFGATARIWVDDEGPGIPETDRTRVFDSFFRLQRDISSPIAGSGIGLSIVRELVALHDGRVWVEDAPGNGARVVVEFPSAYLRPEIAKDEWAVA